MSSKAPDELANIQKLFIEALLRHPGKKVIDRSYTQLAADLFKPSSRQSSLERLSIYRDQYWYRAYDSLVEDFPALLKLFGAEVFENVIAEYLEQYRSSSYTLRDLGKNLPQFCLQSAAVSDEQREVAFQVASFEWAEIVAFDAAEIKSEDLGSTANDPTRLYFALQPHLTLLSLDWAVDAFVQKNFSEGRNTETVRLNRAVEDCTALSPEKEEICLVVFRRQGSVFHKRIDRLPYRMLLMIQDGESLSGIIDRVGLEDGQLSEEELMRVFSESFATWISLGWLCPYIKEASLGGK